MKIAEFKLPTNFFSFNKDENGKVKKERISEITVVVCVDIVVVDTNLKNE